MKFYPFLLFYKATEKLPLNSKNQLIGLLVKSRLASKFCGVQGNGSWAQARRAGVQAKDGRVQANVDGGKAK